MTEDISYSELMQLQDEAIERVRQMQKKAGQAPENSPANKKESDRHKQEKSNEKQKQPIKPEIDKDKAMILPLLLLLMSEGADKLLLLALIYIMA